jgi:hypothetical protein
MSLNDITAELGTAYKEWKGGEKKKNAAKDKFFMAINAELNEQIPAQTYAVSGPWGVGMSEEDAREEFVKRHPGWNVEELRVCSEGWEAILVEDITLAPFTYVNKDEGMVYQRQVVSGSIMLDDERLQADDPELWNLVMEIPNRQIIENVMYECGQEPEDLSAALDTLWTNYNGPRTLKPLETLDDEVLARLSDYIYEGRPTVKLAAPRKAKAEELE